MDIDISMVFVIIEPEKEERWWSKSRYHRSVLFIWTEKEVCFKLQRYLYDSSFIMVTMFFWGYDTDTTKNEDMNITSDRVSMAWHKINPLTRTKCHMSFSLRGLLLYVFSYIVSIFISIWANYMSILCWLNFCLIDVNEILTRNISCCFLTFHVVL